MSRFYVVKSSSSADPEGGGQRVRTPPLENHKNIGFLSNTGPDRLTQSYQASIQCWTIISPQRNAISIAFRWRADNGTFLDIWIFGSSNPSTTKKKKKKKKKKNVIKFGPPLTNLSGSAHVHIQLQMLLCWQSSTDPV